MVRTCKFPGCDHKNVPGSPFRFHRFPVSDMAMRQLWLVAIGYSAGAKISSIKDFRVCSAHFSKDDYIPNQGGKSKKRILKSFAVPVPWCVNTMEQLIGTCALLTLTAARIDGNGKKIVTIKTESLKQACALGRSQTQKYEMGSGEQDAASKRFGNAFSVTML
ncbi:C-terminal-binding protein 1 [Labeo rohita]|uniref:THAP domain-containing protein 1 n=1 Tax=Labeo rohita TaxID=84645 RepID=A0ABQ8L0J8_LABRO|nr:C-terminal-binding protein 1 [Labeo rohita]